ncbi:MAG TPA: DUF924 family protein [Xanthobacteraceae bacterium]|nr:DUF924 family protein [Xanthobacteraceae bacterium]
MTVVATSKQALAFWRKAGPKRWFKADPEFDHKILEKFLVTYQAAELGKLAHWEDEAEGALALVIVLDQFPRNMFRGTARAFATDPLARDAAKRAIERKFDRKIKLAERQFLYLPFEHSESLADQKTALKLFKATKDKEWVRWAKLHYDVIERFGRFPHRNEILGRVSTPEEIDFLDKGGFQA